MANIADPAPRGLARQVGTLVAATPLITKREDDHLVPEAWDRSRAVMHKAMGPVPVEVPSDVSDDVSKGTFARMK